jgi:hypothetical protein
MVTPLVRRSAVMGAGPGLRAAVHRMALPSGNIVFVENREAFGPRRSAPPATKHHRILEPAPVSTARPAELTPPHRAEPGRVHHGFEF